MTDLQIKLNRIITSMSRLETEIDGIVGDLERVMRFEELTPTMKASVVEAHSLSCTSVAAIEEARLNISFNEEKK